MWQLTRFTMLINICNIYEDWLSNVCEPNASDKTYVPVELAQLCRLIASTVKVSKYINLRSKTEGRMTWHKRIRVCIPKAFHLCPLCLISPPITGLASVPHMSGPIGAGLTARLNLSYPGWCLISLLQQLYDGVLACPTRALYPSVNTLETPRFLFVLCYTFFAACLHHQS